MQIEEYLLSRDALALPRQSIRDDDKDQDEIEDRKEEKTVAPIVVSISLVSAAAFQAALTPPDTGDSFGHRFFYQLFFIANTMAFCYALGVALLLVCVRGSHQFFVYSAYIFAAISVAGACLAITFGAAVQLAVGTNNPWLAVIVWGMVLTGIYMATIIFEEKVFLFRRKWMEMLKVVTLPPKFVACKLLKLVPAILGDVFKYF